MANTTNVPARTTEQTAVGRPQQNQHMAQPVRIPAVDVYENGNELLLVADLPGVTQDGLSVEIDRGELRIEGHRYDGGLYRRVFTVPENIDANGIEGNIKDGVLTVRLPKPPELKPRRIAVTGG